MSDLKVIVELEAQLARDEKRFRELEQIEADLLKSVPHCGTRTATSRVNVRTEKKILADRILRNSELLEVARR